MKRGFIGIVIICVILIVAISVFAVFVSDRISGAYTYAPRMGYCCCHNGVYSSARDTLFIKNCRDGIQGDGVGCLGKMSMTACMEICGRDEYWWCSEE